MVHAHKKVTNPANQARQNAQIIAVVRELEDSNMIRLTTDTIYLTRTLWKDLKTALNWMDCLHIYYRLKKQHKSGNLYFKDIKDDTLIGACINKKAKVYISL